MGFYKPENKDYILQIIRNANIAYVSMEIGLKKDVHTYSGGLGILAGDTLYSSADLELPVVGITLIHHKGYFRQDIIEGRQQEEPEPWDIDAYTIALPEGKTCLQLQGRTVHILPRVGIIVGERRHIVPILFLDVAVEENHEHDRGYTDRLYDGDSRMRAIQEAILGIGGKRVLRALNCRNIHTLHMNEGHAAFAPLEDVRYLGKYYGFNKPKIHELVKSGHVFTTHTPVPAGHDRFDYGMLRELFSEEDFAWESIDLAGHYECNMTYLALNLSRYCNAVAKKHGEVSRNMFPGYTIDSITNGVHLPTWTHTAIQQLLDTHLPSWRVEPGILKHAYKVLPHNELRAAHAQAKHDLLAFVKEKTGRELSPDVLTVGFARRFAPYKRADLLFTDIERLRSIAQQKIQFIFAGEAHPRDEAGKDILAKVIRYTQELQGDIEIVFIPDYNIECGQKMTQGCDLWLNNPIPPKEASGTSGMKATANAVPNLSTLDGWWIEGITKDPLAGWIIEHREDERDEISLYEQLERITHIYYDQPERWSEHMVHALSLAHYFNTHRMVQEYETKAWTRRIYN